MTELQTRTDMTDGPGVAHGLNYKALHRFTLKLAQDDKPTQPSEADELRKELNRLQAVVRDQAIEADVASGRVLPRDRELFMRRAGTEATLADWQIFRDGTPKPNFAVGRQPQTVQTTRSSESDPGAEVAERVKEAMAKDVRLTYTQAMVAVLRADPALAQRYRDAPGEQN